MSDQYQNNYPEVYIRGDRSGWDLHNLFVAPYQELVRYRELVRNIISRDLKVRYKRSILGVFWTILSPLLSLTVLFTVFKFALKVDIPNYAAYLLSGIIIWSFFVQSSAAGAASILNSAGLLQKVRLPRVLFPISTVVNNAINFSFAFVALLIVMAISQTDFHFTILLAPIMLIPLIFFVMGWAMMMSALTVFFRDLQYIVDISLGALFYLTPIVYEPSMLPERFQWIVSVNPIAKFMHLFRSVVYAGEIPPLRVYLVSCALGLAMFLIGWIAFQRLQKKFLYWF